MELQNFSWFLEKSFLEMLLFLIGLTLVILFSYMSAALIFMANEINIRKVKKTGLKSLFCSGWYSFYAILFSLAFYGCFALCAYLQYKIVNNLKLSLLLSLGIFIHTWLEGKIINGKDKKAKQRT